MIGEVAHGFSAGLLALLSVPERSSGAFLLMSEPLSGALAALRGFRRRWAEPEPGPEVALGAPSVHSVTPDTGLSALLIPRPQLLVLVPYLLLRCRDYFGVSPLAAPFLCFQVLAISQG